jgi:hypothetical protein
MMHRRLPDLGHIARRDPQLLVLAVQVYVLLVVMRGVISVLPLRRITQHLGVPVQEIVPEALSPEQLRYARRVGWTIEKLAPHTPTNSNCYPQALTARWLLHRKRIASTVFYGAAFEPGRPALAAHVWLRAGPLVVTGGSPGRSFRALSWFTDVPAPHPERRRYRASA